MAKKFEIPADLSTLGAQELSDALEAADAAFAELSEVPDEELTDEQADTIFGLADFRVAAGERQAQIAERSERLAAARQALATKPEDEEIPAIAEEEIPPGTDNEEDEVAKRAASSESVTASAGSLAVRAARSNKGNQQVAPERPRLSLTAAADVKGIPAGETFDSLVAAGAAISSRLKSFPQGFVKNTHIQHGALVIQTPENKFSDTNYPGNHTQMLLEAASEKRLEGGSLVAAGSWGAPSELVRDFCNIEDIGNLIDLPEVTITHGGIQYTKGPTFGDVFNSATGFWDMTEAVAEAGTELKTSIRPAIPPFIEERLDAVGAMMEAGLLTRAGYPELVERYASLVLTAHQFKLAMKKIAMLEAFTGPATNIARGFGNELDILHILELVATGERQRNAMNISETLEAIIPFWVKPAIRAGLANRSGVENFLSITDAQIDAFFTARNIRVQWVNAYQNLALDPTSGLALSYPDTFEVIMYPAGTYVVGAADVITLDTIYDSVNLKKNDYVHLFVEQGILLTNPCGDGVRIEVPLVINGQAAQNTITKEFGTLAGV